MPTSENQTELPDWEELLSSLCRQQGILPDVGFDASAARLHAGCFSSRNRDLPDLRSHFDNVLRQLEEVAGLTIARTPRQVSILGRLDGIETGIRQLRRNTPLETMTWAFRDQPLTVPTPAESLRIKVWLALTRNAARDYLDAVALADSLGERTTIEALMKMDELCPQENGSWSVRTQMVKQFAEPRPYDLDEVDLGKYKGVKPPYNSWSHMIQRCSDLAVRLIFAFRSTGQVLAHRHLNHNRFTLAAIDDIIERGQLPEWQPLLAAIRRDPHGEIAEKTLKICWAHPVYGGTRVFRDFIEWCRRERERGQQDSVD